MTPFARHIFRKSLIAFALLCGISQFQTTYAGGLPANFLVTQRWKYLLSSRSALANPALINEENYVSAKLALSSVLSTFRMLDGEVVYPIDLYQTAGVSWLHAGVNSYARTNEQLEIFGDSISDSKNHFALTYAINFWKGLSAGLNVTLLNEVFDKSSSISFGTDVGLTYRVINNAFMGHHVLGANLQNLFMISLSSANKQQYPRTMRFSLNSNYWERRVESGVEFAIKDLLVSAKEFIEGAPRKSEWDLNARIGVWVIRLATLNGILGMSDRGLEHVGFSAGLNFPSINNGRDLSIAYQFLNVLNEKTKEYNAPNHTAYFKGDFGKHREEVYARKMARLFNLQPNELYIKAVELYSQGNYWDAFFIFSQLQVEYPDFFKNDWVGFFIGSCQEKLDMRITAIEAYSKMKEKFDRSAAVPFADLGLMIVYYRDNNYQAVERQFNELNKLGVPDSLKYHAYYLMGEAEMNQGKNAKAKQLFDLLPENHPDYVFAQHSSAIADVLAGNIESAISRLENCIQAPALTNAQREIINRSYVFLGYVFYEELTKQEGPLAKAVTALRSDPKTSYFYPDALVGLGWTALKARQWDDCISSGSELFSIAPGTVLKAEGALLQAYAYMMQKNYSSAISLLENASRDLESFTGLSESEFASKKNDYTSNRSTYTQIARGAYDLGAARQSGIVLKQVDSLHIHQKDLKSMLDGFLEYSDNFKRVSMFSKNVESVREDVDYALAKAQKIAGQSRQTVDIKKALEEEKKIDEEMKRLKEELRKEEGK